MSWRSTTLRSALLVFVLQILAAVALLAVTSAVVHKQIRNDAEIRSETLRKDMLATYVLGGFQTLAQAVRDRTERAVIPGEVLLLIDRGGRHVAGNLADWPPDISTASSYGAVSLYRVRHAAAEAMRVRATSLNGGARLLTGSVVEGEQRVVRSLGGAAAVGISLAVMFAALAAWLSARLIVSRLATTIDTLQGVLDGDLGRRVHQDDSGDAFALLGKAVNVALARVEGLVGELRIATDGLAHDLKSPLTRLRSALERAALEVREPAAQQAIDRALGEGDRLLAIVETSLRISRAEGGVGRDSFVPIDLVSVLNDVAEIYGPLAEDAGRSIEIDAPSTATVAGQRDLFAQAIGNLVDNALKYGAGTITLRIEVARESATVVVADRGAGIPPDRRDQALARFGRLDEARRESGAGLGLALAGSVARLHGGALDLADAGPGLAVRIVFPTI